MQNAIFTGEGTFRGSFLSFIEQVSREALLCGRFKSAEAYRSAGRSLSRFLKGRDLAFDELDPRLVGRYEGWLRSCGVVPNTVSYYMRLLRAVYNKGRRRGLVSREHPFREVYTGIDTTRKRAVDEGTMHRLRDLRLEGPDAFARDLFLLSFYTRGMSFVDLAFLRTQDAQGGMIRYRRRKTGRPLAVCIEPCMASIIARYAAPVRPNGYLLPILRSDDPATAFRQYRTALIRYNRSLARISRLLGIEPGLNSHVARHTWATIAYRRRLPVSIISEGLGHDSEQTTRIYLAAFDQSAIDRANRAVIDGF